MKRILTSYWTGKMARKTRNSTRRRRKKNDGLSKANILKIMVLVAFFPSIMFLFLSQRSSVGEIDPLTFCDRGEISPVISILIDVSDEIEIVKRTNIINDLTSYANTIPKNARVDIYFVTGIEKSLPTAVFSKCNPGEPRSYDGLTRNEVTLRRRFEKEFIGELKKALTSELVGKPAKHSPIIESIRSVAAQSFTGLFDRNQSQLIVVSDMLQNTKVYSHYKGDLDFEAFNNSPQWANAFARLDGVEVRLMYIMRGGNSLKFQNKEHIGWWEQYFLANKAEITRIDRY